MGDLGNIRGMGGGLRVRTVLAVVLHAGRIVAAHWPVLLVLFFTGQAVRNGVLWLAVWATSWNHLVGALLLPLAPLATLSALILMLRVVAPSLHAGIFDGGVTDDVPQGGRHWRDIVGHRLALLASTLVPFFAVYAAQGYLREDQFIFVNLANADEFLNNADFWLGNGTLDSERTVIASGSGFWLLVAVAFGLRWLIGRLGLPRRGTPWGLLAAYVEVTWVALLATGAASQIDGWKEWIADRQLVATLSDWWSNAVSAMGALGEPLQEWLGWLIGAVTSFDVLVVVPLAWLTVGAVVYGRSLGAEDAPSGEATEGATATVTRRVPAAVRRAAGEMTEDLRGRFQGLIDGLTLLGRAGLAPMLTFCLVFLLAKLAETGVGELARWAIGPRSPNDMVPFAPYVDLIGRAAYTVVVVGLLSAAIDRLLSAQGSSVAPGGLSGSGQDCEVSATSTTEG